MAAISQRGDYQARGDKTRATASAPAAPLLQGILVLPQAFPAFPLSIRCFIAPAVFMHWNQASLVSDLKDAVKHTLFLGKFLLPAVSTNMAATVKR